MIGITAPEAIALADYIRRNLPNTEAKRIHDLALQNSKIIDGNHEHRRGDEIPCALLSGQCLCLTYAARPLQCRPLHARMIGRELGLGIADAESRNPPTESPVRAIELGLEAGLVEELDDAGLDANSYELNAALVVALDTPDVANRWLKGENVFAGCPICH
jgi:Fe-S-cluster containining protein